MASWRSIKDLKLSKLNRGSITISNCGILKCFSSASSMIWAPTVGLVEKLRPSSLTGARPYNVLMYWSSFWSFQSTSTSLLACALEGRGGDRASVDPSSDQDEGDWPLVHLGLCSAMGWVGSSHSRLYGRESHLHSQCTTPNTTRSRVVLLGLLLVVVLLPCYRHH